MNKKQSEEYLKSIGKFEPKSSLSKLEYQRKYRKEHPRIPKGKSEIPDYTREDKFRICPLCNEDIFMSQNARSHKPAWLFQYPMEHPIWAHADCFPLLTEYLVKSAEIYKT